MFTTSIVLLAGFRSARTPLVIVSSDPNVNVSSVVCTFGTNHVYYWGGAVDRLMDPLVTRLSDRNANRMWCRTREGTTVVWVRFVHPDYGIAPPQRPRIAPPGPFRAQLIGTNGAVTPLETVDALMQSYRHRFLVMGWEIAGQLEAHRGSQIRIEATNGIGSVTFRVP